MSIWSDRGFPVISIGFDIQGNCVIDAEIRGIRVTHEVPRIASLLSKVGRVPADSLFKGLCKAVHRSPYWPPLEEFSHQVRESVSGAAIWLDFPGPSGTLPALPWEALLQGDLKIPVFRLPSHEILPVTDTATLSVIVYVDLTANYSTPAEISDLEDLLQWISLCAPSIGIDLFAEKRIIRRLLPEGNLKSSKLARAGMQKAITSHSLRSGIPWTSQVQSAKPGASIDLLLIVAPTTMRDRRASLLMSFGAKQRRTVSPEEVGQCATNLGAWSVGLIDVSGNGGRMLAHELAAARPGPVIAAQQARAVGRMYHRLLTGQRDADILLSGTTGGASVYVHPDGANAGAPEVDPSAPDEHRREKLREVLDTATVGNIITAVDPPRWLASNQRILEQFAEPLLQDPPNDDIASARRIGYAAGLEDAASILANSYQQGKG